jgi:predicted  nucleic acid-binding Zn-ribbon protein
MGCRIKLPSVEIDRIRHLEADAVYTCEECGVILVRSF